MTQAYLAALEKLQQHLEGSIKELEEPKEAKKETLTPFDPIEG